MTGDISEKGRERISCLEKTDDGFEIAEADLEIRGPGEMTGTRQCGGYGLKIADLVADRELLEAAREDAARIVAEDPALSGPNYDLLGVWWRELGREAIAGAG